MRTALIILIICGFLLSAGAAYFYKEENTALKTPSTTAPDFTFQTPDGQNRALTDFRGQVVILNFWASWCAPCVKEFPLLLRAARKYPDDVTLIALSSDLTQEAFDRFIAKQKITPNSNIYVALDKDMKITENIYSIQGLPLTHLISKDGKLTHTFKGAQWKYEELEKDIKMLLSTNENGS